MPDNGTDALRSVAEGAAAEVTVLVRMLELGNAGPFRYLTAERRAAALSQARALRDLLRSPPEPIRLPY